MFNPQRKSKFVDMLMQEKAFQKHLDKVNGIKHSSSPTSQRIQEQKQQKKYLKRLHQSKEEVKQRLHNQRQHQNHRLFQKLLETDKRPEENPQHDLPQKHFNSYFNHKRQDNRIRADNFGMASRMMNQSSMVPSLAQMKKDFKQNKRYARMVRKLPTILKRQDQFRRDLSSMRLQQSKTSLRSSMKSSRRREKSLQDRAVTQNIRHIESALVARQE